ncbi:MAG: cisplatin damage response ATP-dependent DNA ligase [Pseudomonadota bacterium]
MTPFSRLMDALVLTPARNAKLRLLQDYFAAAPDPDRGWALAAITGGLDLKAVKPALLRALVAERVDAELFALSYDYVGDLAETIALIWPETGADPVARSLGEVVDELSTISKAEAPARITNLLDTMPAAERYALIKLATGGMRMGVSARLAKQALANFGDVPVEEIEEIWHGLEPPFEPLFQWLEGGEKPVSAARAPFRPVMLATAFEERDQTTYEPRDYAAEWKWDGIRVQAVAEGGVRRLYTRTGEDISATFGDLLDEMDFEAALDGELLVRRGGEIGSFGDLQQRLNRKRVPKAMLTEYPACLRAYDILRHGEEDPRPLPYDQRRARLRDLLSGLPPDRFDLSDEVAFDDWAMLDAMRAAPPHKAIEGVMLKRRDAPYQGGRPRGPWFKWKRDPYLIDAVLMYAQRGHGKRSSFYSDYTFGVWTEDGSLTPVGKAYFGFTDEELKQIDKFVRAHTIDRFGPVRAVTANRDEGLVLEVAFEGLNRSTRHKSGVAMRFPRISRLRWDKPPHQADHLASLQAMLADG